MVNEVHLIGRVGGAVEVKTSNDKIVAKFSLATGYKDSTDWHNVVCFGKTAEFAKEYISKGKLIYLNGRIKYGSYVKDDVKHYTVDIIANSFQLLSPKDKEA